MRCRGRGGGRRFAHKPSCACLPLAPHTTIPLIECPPARATLRSRHTPPPPPPPPSLLCSGKYSLDSLPQGPRGALFRQLLPKVQPVLQASAATAHQCPPLRLHPDASPSRMHAWDGLPWCWCVDRGAGVRPPLAAPARSTNHGAPVTLQLAVPVGQLSSAICAAHACAWHADAGGRGVQQAQDHVAGGHQLGHVQGHGAHPGREDAGTGKAPHARATPLPAGCCVPWLRGQLLWAPACIETGQARGVGQGQGRSLIAAGRCLLVWAHAAARARPPAAAAAALTEVGCVWWTVPPAPAGCPRGSRRCCCCCTQATDNLGALGWKLSDGEVAELEAAVRRMEGGMVQNIFQTS